MHIISNAAAKAIFFGYGTMQQKQLAKIAGVSLSTVERVARRYNLLETSPEQAYEAFLNKKGACFWSDEETAVLLEHFDDGTHALEKLIPEKTVKMIRNKRSAMQAQARTGKLSPEASKIVLAHSRVTRLGHEYRPLPELVIGKKYVFQAPEWHRSGKVLSYYIKGKYYLVQFRKFRETISQVDLYLGQVIAKEKD